MIYRVGIALGSNLGNKLVSLQMARDSLRNLAAANSHYLQASIFQTAPQSCPLDSPDFFNSVIEIGYHGSPRELLQHTQALETSLGRVLSRVRNSPRVIDIDLLYFENLTHQSADLTLPHPRLTERRFVLAPLAEIRPELEIFTKKIQTHLSQLSFCDSNPPVKVVLSHW